MVEPAVNGVRLGRLETTSRGARDSAWHTAGQARGQRPRQQQRAAAAYARRERFNATQVGERAQRGDAWRGHWLRFHLQPTHGCAGRGCCRARTAAAPQLQPQDGHGRNG